MPVLDVYINFTVLMQKLIHFINLAFIRVISVPDTCSF